MKIKKAAVDIDKMELKCGNIKSACSYIETLINYGNAAQVLSTKGDVGTRIKQLITMETKLQTRYDKVVLQPSVEFSESGILGILDSIYEIEISKCTVENLPKQLWKGDSADLLITTRDSTGKQVNTKHPVKAKVRKPDASWEDISVADNRDGTHRVTVTGQLDGKYQVTVTIRDQPIPGYPVIIGLVKTIGCQGSAEGQYNYPWSVAVNKDGDIVTADRNNNRFGMTARDGKFKKILKCEQFEKPFTPRDIAISDDNTCLCLDDNNKQAQVGDGKRKPRRIAIENDKYVYVTTDSPSNLLKFESSGKFVCRVDSDRDRLNFPSGIALTDDVPCRVVVADTFNHCIKVFVQ
ncbi:E3 ubiquitin-protein ligase TRIM71-like [Ptychodera flava]|uniref:E3 ubiquitin-protein ligase TRIM71-like n=1 Tax=Ptychodera flava TaxID=63121 RepID=UPI00396A43EE